MPDIQDAISLIEAGEPRKAADLLEQLAEEMPGYATARVLLARAYERLSEWEPALRAWRDAQQIIPNSPVVRRGLERAVRKASVRTPDSSRWKGPAPPPVPMEEAPPSHRHVDKSDPSLPPFDESEPSLPPFDESEPSLPPLDESEPSPPPFYESEPSLPPLDESEPSLPPVEEVEPSYPPVDEEAIPPTGEGAPEPPRAEDLSDLDRLISELESARIVPRPDPENVTPPDLEDDIEDVVSETLARIYASQGQFFEAAHVYGRLAEQQPEKASEYEGKASEMRMRASQQG